MAEVIQNASSATSSNWQRWEGGRGHFSAWGTFDTATVALEQRLPDGTAVQVGSDTTFTGANSGLFDLPQGTKIRATVSSTGASTNVSASIGRV